LWLISGSKIVQENGMKLFVGIGLEWSVECGVGIKKAKLISLAFIIVRKFFNNLF
jgi:hypothetical protein